MSVLREYLDTRRAAIDTALDGCLPTAPDCPARLAEAMRYSVFAGGKRLRPVLTLAAAEAVVEVLAGRGDPCPSEQEMLDLVLPAACAIEMIHTYSLIHDDLPSMDDDTMRRGRPTLHVAAGEGLAILAGDALLTEAFVLLASLPADPSPAITARKLRTIERVASAAGALGMVAGQTIDLDAAVTGAAPQDGDALEAMHARKTGALIRAAVVSGAIMIGAPDPLMAAVDQYAAHLGLAFQIVDDILDVEGAPADLGKTAGKDAAAGKPTYPSVYGLDESRRLATRSIADARTALAAAGLGGRLAEIADWVGERRS